MAIKKKAAKPAAKKPAPKKVVAVKPVKKSAPAKSPVKAAAKKVAKSVPKKAIAKPIPKKPVIKVAPKKATKPVAKAPAKVVAKTAVKQVTKSSAAPVPKKPVAPVKISKSVAVPAAKKNGVVSKPPTQPMAKKTEDKKIAPKVVAKPPAKPTPAAKSIKDIKVAPAKPIVFPKTNTKIARDYQPDFTKSVLDQPKHDLGASIVRYSDSDLTEFRELIQRKLGAAKKELSYLQGLITRKDEMGGDEGDNRYMTMEDGSLSMEREQLSQMASRQITFIDHLEKALMRIENKTYGICRVTGKLIDKARLRAVPHATLSIEAKMGQR